MKVVFAHTDFRIYWPVRLQALYDFLRIKNITLNVIEIAGTGSPYNFAGESNNYPAFWHCLFPGKRIEDISSYTANRALRRKLDELKPDIVFAGAIAFPSGAAAIRWTTENQKKCVIFDNARLKDVPRKCYVNFIKRQIYSAVDAVFCPSSAWNETFRYYGFSDEQIFHGLNVVDNAFWSETENVPILNLPEKFFLTVGRQILKKNFLFLLKAYRNYSLKTRDPVSLIMIGNGPERKNLEFFSKKHKIKTVRFLPFATQEELRSLYHSGLCFILPSKHGETWGLVVNEAMASGLPVLVSEQAGCASTLLKDGVNGFTFPPDDVVYLEYLMNKVTDMPINERKEMGRNSRRLIEQWGIDRFCKGVLDSIQFVSGYKNKKLKPGSKVMIRLWKGRYRPT